MANTEWWQRGPVEGVPALLQPIAHILLQVDESAGELVESLTESQWNARGEKLTPEQFAAIRSEGEPLTSNEVPTVMAALRSRIEAAVAVAKSGTI